MSGGEEFDRAVEDLSAGPGATEAEPDTSREETTVRHPTVDALRDRFGDAVLRHELYAGDEHVVFVAPERLGELMRWLKAADGQRYDFLKDVTAVDYGGGRPIQVVYELWSMEHRRQLRVKAELPLDGLEIESVVPIWQTANWLEREVYDLFGVRFSGHPDLRRIMMPENYAEGHPLRKDFPLRGRFTRAEQTRRALAMELEDYYTEHELQVVRDADPSGRRRAIEARTGEPELAEEVPEGSEFEVEGEDEA